LKPSGLKDLQTEVSSWEFNIWNFIGLDEGLQHREEVDVEGNDGGEQRNPRPDSEDNPFMDPAHPDLIVLSLRAYGHLSPFAADLLLD
jgi:hypothetical protein